MLHLRLLIAALVALLLATAASLCEACLDDVASETRCLCLAAATTAAAAAATCSPSLHLYAISELFDVILH